MNLATLLQQIDRLKSEIDALRPIDTEQERRIMQKFRLEWTYHSNAIEGNTLSFGETKAFLLHGITAQGKPFRDYLDVKGHHAAIDELLAFVRERTPLTEAMIRELHKMILVEPYDMPAQTMGGQRAKRRIEPGQYKTMPNHVETSSGEIHYYASPEETPAKMADLVAWYRREEDKGDLHPLLLASTFHYEFVAIHPFDDGNGRMARLLMNLILMQAGYPPIVIQIDNKNEYLLALEIADADDNLEPFIEIVGQALHNSLALFLRGAKGESIEEYSDVEKKISLLNKKLKESDTYNYSVNKLEQNRQLLQKFIEPLFNEIFSQFSKFDALFLRNSIWGKISVATKTQEYKSIGKQDFLLKIKNVFETDPMIGNISFLYEWSDLINRNKGGVKLNFDVDLQGEKILISGLLRDQNRQYRKQIKIPLLRTELAFTRSELEEIIAPFIESLYQIVEKSASQ